MIAEQGKGTAVAKSKVLLVDDHAIVRKGLVSLLEAEDDFTVVGEAGTVAEALAAVKSLRPDLVTLDVTLPDGSGLKVIGDIKESVPSARVVIVTMHEEEDYFFRALQAGAAGYVVKGGNSDDVLAALRAAREGGVYLHPGLAKVLVSDHVHQRSDSVTGDLSARELEALKLIGQGLVGKQIAAQMGISTATLQTYRARIMEKVGLHSVAELVRYAIRKGIVQP